MEKEKPSGKCGNKCVGFMNRVYSGIKKVVEGNKNQVTSSLFFLLLLLGAFYCLNLFIFMVLFMTVRVAEYGVTPEKIDESVYHRFMVRIYAILPNFSLLYLATSTERKIDLFTWLLLLFLSIKLVSYFFRDMFGDGPLPKFLQKFYGTKTAGELIGSFGAAVVIGLTASLFLKQKIAKFLVVNLTLWLLLQLQDRVNHWIGKMGLIQEENLFLKYYNQIAIPSIFLWLSFLFGLISL